MLNTLKTFNYHNELILTLLKTTLIASVASNIIAPIFYYVVFKEWIPQPILIGWLVLMICIFIFRFIIHTKLLAVLPLSNRTSTDKLLKLYLFAIFLSAFFWGLSSIPVLIYANESHVFILIALILSMSTTSMSTLGAIFHALIIFIVSIVLPIIFALVFIGAAQLYYYTALLLFIYISISIPAGFRIFSSLNNVIIQNEKIKVLNESLEQRVQKAVQESKQNEKILQDQSRLAQMGEMISMIAHQWRQPLSAISSAVMGIQTKLASGQFNLEKKEDRDKLFAFMEKKHKNINEYVQFLSTTIDDFRNFFKPNKNKEMISLTLPVDRALQIIQTSMSAKGIVIETDYQIEDTLFLYQNELMQVILNILKNCEDNFLEENIINPHIKISTKRDHDDYIISILDNGGGIAEDILPKIFDPYFSTKSEKNGTGIGLYMSKIMVEEHNSGKLEVVNRDDGVCFKIILKSQNDK